MTVAALIIVACALCAAYIQQSHQLARERSKREELAKRVAEASDAVLDRWITETSRRYWLEPASPDMWFDGKCWVAISVHLRRDPHSSIPTPAMVVGAGDGETLAGALKKALENAG